MTGLRMYTLFDSGALMQRVHENPKDRCQSSVNFQVLQDKCFRRKDMVDWVNESTRSAPRHRRKHTVFAGWFDSRNNPQRKLLHLLPFLPTRKQKEQMPLFSSMRPRMTGRSPES